MAVLLTAAVIAARKLQSVTNPGSAVVVTVIVAP